jgi:hypothetical protein
VGLRRQVVPDAESAALGDGWIVDPAGRPTSPVVSGDCPADLDAPAAQNLAAP